MALLSAHSSIIANSACHLAQKKSDLHLSVVPLLLALELSGGRELLAQAALLCSEFPPPSAKLTAMLASIV
jgi:hypothetical protein